MATIWTESDEGFLAKTLPDGGLPHEDEIVLDTWSPGLRLVRQQNENRPSHAVVAAEGTTVRVNGEPVVGGRQVLQHKDEVIADDQRMFYSSETTPVVVSYRHDGSKKHPRCPMCRAEIQEGELVVHCPGCGRAYHQETGADAQSERPCWVYSPTCRFCEHPTSMSGEPTWRPEDE